MVGTEDQWRDSEIGRLAGLMTGYSQALTKLSDDNARAHRAMAMGHKRNYTEIMAALREIQAACLTRHSDWETRIEGELADVKAEAVAEAVCKASQPTEGQQAIRWLSARAIIFVRNAGYLVGAIGATVGILGWCHLL